MADGGGALTKTGMSLGTPTYMSPEQAFAEKDIDGRSDMCSLACVLYEMLTERSAVHWPERAGDHGASLDVSAPSMQIVRATIPMKSRTLCRRRLRKRPPTIRNRR